jgi:hypothetical protein
MLILLQSLALFGAGPWDLSAHVPNANADKVTQLLADVGTVKASAPRGCVLYLITYGDDKQQMMPFFTDLLQSVQCTHKFYTKKFGHAIVIFYAGQMPQDHQKQILAVLPSAAEVRFIPIEFDFPRKIAANSTFMDKECGKAWTEGRKCGCTCSNGCYWHENYLHMNRFRTLKMW